MNKEDLLKRLEDVEWDDCEFKEAAAEVPKSSWETVSAFSNTSGGWLVFGVKSAGTKYVVTGVQNADKITNDFMSAIRGGKFNKPLEVKPKKYGLPEGTVLAFWIPPKSPQDRPVYFDNQKNTFIRAGGVDQRATQAEVDSFFRQASFSSKDSERTELSVDALDRDTVTRYRQYFSNLNPGHRYIGLSDEEFLDKVGALENGKVTYAGLLLFGSEESIRKTLPHYKIDYIEVPGTSYDAAATRYSHRVLSEKNVFTTFFDVYEPLTRRVEVPFSVRGGIRDDDPPHLQAIREALVNLLIHADYFSQRTSRIRVFSDRYEFENAGGLPKDLKTILKQDYHQPRNPTLARAFRQVKLAEAAGSGFTKMFSGWNSTYKLKPMVEGNFDYYKITFPITKTNTNTITKTINKAGQKEAEILTFIEQNPHHTAEEIAKEVGLTPAGVRYHISNLKRKGRLVREGGSKKGCWAVKNSH